MGTTPKLYINNNEKIKTVFGGILSFFTALILLASVGYFSNLLFSRSSFNVILNEEYNPKPFKNWTNEEFSIILIDRYMNDIPNRDKLYNIYADYWWNKPYEDTNGEIKYKIQLTEVKLETCNLTKHFSSSIDLWRDQKLINQSYCMKRDQNFYSSYLFGANNYTGVVFWIHKCVNNTNKNNCAPKEEIDKALTNVFFLVRFKDYYFNHDSLNDVAIPFIYSDQMQASSTAYKRLWYYFRNVEYQSDNGFIFPEIKLDKFTNFAGTRDGTDLRTTPTIPGTFAVVSLNTFTLKQVYLRKYYKVQNMIADLGGILKSILMMSYIINYYFSNKLYFDSIISYNIHNYSNNKDLNNSSMIINNYDGLKINSYFTNLNKPPESKISVASAAITKLNKNTEINSNLNTIQNRSKTNLNLKEIILPIFCFSLKTSSRKKLELREMIKKILYSQLDINEVISKLNSVDKMMFIFNGNKFIKNFVNSNNPIYTSEMKIDDSNKICYENWMKNYKSFMKINENVI